MYEIFGPYQLIEKLASGGMAEIFKARTFGHSGFEKTLVIKRLHPRYTQTPEFVEMLKEEAKTAVGLSHANIVQIFDLGRVQEHYYIAMEYINGRDLNQLMNRCKDQRLTVPAEAALYLTAEVCAGLDFAHRQRDMNGKLLRLIHRDVSPQNIMISQEGEVKIVDFGIAKSLASQQETEAGVIKGKFCFMSPEQARGQKLDHRTDIFSAGIMLYELLAGQPMYDNSDDHQLLHQVRNAQFIPIETLRPDLPTAIHKVVNRALAVDREKRYPSARHLQHALEKVMQKSGLMFSRFQLGQLLANCFPQLAPIEDDILNSYDGFENEELSLISDYEAQYNNRGDWDVPEFTDEMEEIEIEDLEEFTDEVDPNLIAQAAHLGGLSRNATPVPIQRQGAQPYQAQAYAPAAPPPNDAHLYDPSYQAPSYNSSNQKAPTTLGVAGHAQVTQPPKSASSTIDQQSLYSSEVPSVGRAPQPQQIDKMSGDAFAQVDSTMILDDEVPQSQRKQSVYSRPIQSKRQPKDFSDKFKDLKILMGSKSRQLFNDPIGRYLIAGLGFILVFTLAQALKKQFSNPQSSQRQPTLQLGMKATSGLANPQVNPISSPKVTPPPLNKALIVQQNPIQNPIQNQRYNQPVNQPITPLPNQPTQVLNYQSPNQQRANGSNNIVPIQQNLNQQTTMPQDPNLPIQAPTTMRLRIETNPPGAELSVNDEWQARTTPITVEVTVGEMTLLTFSKEGFEERREKIWPQLNQSTLTFNLDAQSGHLIINTSPSGATITRDGEVLGKTPFEREDFPLKPTEFRIELSKRGYLPKAYRMSWLNADRGTLELDATLIAEEKPKPKKKRRRRRRPKARRTPRPSGNGYMSVKASRWGHLFVDNRFVKEGKIVLRHRVSAGRHRVKFCFEGDRGNCVQKSVSISNGDHQKVFF